MKSGITLRKMKKKLLTAGAVAGLLLAVNFLPTLTLRTQEMRVFKGRRVNVYYEDEEAAALDTFAAADARAGELARLLGVEGDQKINIYIYDAQSTMQKKKYGLIGAALGLDWYIGDNIKSDVILTSPANPGSVHHYEDVKKAALHEIVHAYNDMLNEDMSYFVDNGLAGYLSGQRPVGPCDLPIPTLAQTQVKGLLAPVRFADFGGYEYAYTYIAYLNGTYSWEKVRSFAKSGDFEREFGRTERQVYDDWVSYMTSG